MRDCKSEFEARTAFIRDLMEKSGADGIVYGNSGGKDSALVGILCKAACENTVGIIMPCGSDRNYGEDADDGRTVAEKFGIETRTVDLTPVWKSELKQISDSFCLNASATVNIAPRLRMLTLYAAAAAENRLVAGTGNRSEGYLGYFTKWGDGAYDFNPISDLTAAEVYDFLRFLGAPHRIIEKAPSAGLFDGQTDEAELGITYDEVDSFLFGKAVSEKARERIENMHEKSAHKREGAVHYANPF